PAAAVKWLSSDPFVLRAFCAHVPTVSGQSACNSLGSASRTSLLQPIIGLGIRRSAVSAEARPARLGKQKAGRRLPPLTERYFRRDVRFLQWTSAPFDLSLRRRSIRPR